MRYGPPAGRCSSPSTRRSNQRPSAWRTGPRSARYRNGTGSASRATRWFAASAVGPAMSRVLYHGSPSAGEPVPGDGRVVLAERGRKIVTMVVHGDEVKV